MRIHWTISPIQGGSTRSTCEARKWIARPCVPNGRSGGLPLRVSEQARVDQRDQCGFRPGLTKLNRRHENLDVAENGREIAGKICGKGEPVPDVLNGRCGRVDERCKQGPCL